MNEIGEPVPESAIAESMEDVKAFAVHIEELEQQTGQPAYPIIVRPAYTLGGTGGGIAYNWEELHDISVRGFRMSMTQQLLLERYLLGWKEIEYEVMRDGNGQLHHHLQHGELRPDGHPHGRLHRHRAQPDAH